MGVLEGCVMVVPPALSRNFAFVFPPQRLKQTLSSPSKAHREVCALLVLTGLCLGLEFCGWVSEGGGHHGGQHGLQGGCPSSKLSLLSVHFAV